MNLDLYIRSLSQEDVVGWQGTVRVTARFPVDNALLYESRYEWSEDDLRIERPFSDNPLIDDRFLGFMRSMMGKRPERGAYVDEVETGKVDVRWNASRLRRRTEQNAERVGVGTVVRDGRIAFQFEFNIRNGQVRIGSYRVDAGSGEFDRRRFYSEVRESPDHGVYVDDTGDAVSWESDFKLRAHQEIHV